ncbi:helix-turn-helix transcriptional regulator [Acetobacter okinawensis]|uniref:helix-turn-helix domain-containing protein n=1 Tax=Acetobacter okinawensis TaxID=1076594 RepID=UPI000A3829BD
MSLREIRKSKGLTLGQAAALVGCHLATWQKWEKGQVPPHRAIELEKVLGIPRHILRPDLFANMQRESSAA